MKSKIYRQGDVSIQRVEKIPAGLSKVKGEKGRVILAHGEVTGHHHSFCVEEVERLRSEDGQDFFKVAGEKYDCRLPIMRTWKNQVMVQHPQKGIIEFSKNDVVIEDGHVLLNGAYALLTHQEHHAHGIPAGLYKGTGAGDTVRQREYSPEAIRNNSD